jgi:hypothetical protein
VDTPVGRLYPFETLVIASKIQRENEVRVLLGRVDASVVDEVTLAVPSGPNSLGGHGFYERIGVTTDHLGPGTKWAIVNPHISKHSGSVTPS